MSCSHKDNVIITIELRLHEEIEIIDGEIACLASGDPQLLKYRVDCTDCGKMILMPEKEFRHRWFDLFNSKCD